MQNKVVKNTKEFASRIIIESLQLLSIVSYILLVNCTNVHRGAKFEKSTLQDMQQMVDKKSTIQQITSKFGTPSFTNSPIDNTICYIDASGTKVAFNRFYNPTYNFICIYFEKNIAKSLENFSLTEIKREKFVEYKTDFKKPL